jgi:selenocysteine lyase/cysteine desulfurase
MNTLTTRQMTALLEKRGAQVIDVRPVDAYNGWRMPGEARGAELKVILVDENGRLVLEALKVDKTRLFAVTYVSGALGIVNPVEQIIGMAHARNVPVMLDAAQAVQHMPLWQWGPALRCPFVQPAGCASV